MSRRNGTIRIADGTQLKHADISLPGVTRERTGDAWRYRDINGRIIRKTDEIERLNRIALPPAYENAWYSPDPDGHIQAVGFDARGRRQYRYHPSFRAHQEAGKFDRCADFGRALPQIRKQVAKDLARRKLDRERAVASVVRILDAGILRVGNEAYTKANKSFGATTLRMRHAKLKGHRLTLKFRGKSGQQQEVAFNDRHLARFVRRMADLPGQELFQYVNGDGEPAPVGSAMVNDYIHEKMGADFSAKHFRTWHASVIALEIMLEALDAGNFDALTIKQVALGVSDRLGNTPAIARKSYIHPHLLALIGDGARTLARLKRPRATRWLSSSERTLIALLDKRRSVAAAVRAGC